MDYFTKKRLAFWGVALLVIVNISALATVWFQQHRPWRGPEPGRRESPPQRVSQFLKQELALTEAQTRQFAELQNRHFTQARATRDAIRDLKDELFRELSAAAPDTAKAERLAAAIGARQSELEKMTFYHFLALKRLGTPAQQKKLEALFGELLRLLDPRRQQPGEGPPPRAGEPRH